MAQAARSNVTGNNSQPLTQEQARQIATKSHARLAAIRNQSSPPPAMTKTPEAPQATQPQRHQTMPPPSSSAGVHRTKAGKPDRRYVENQHLTDQEAEIERAKAVLRNAGITSIE